jgi:hypothetical protein
VSFDRAVAAAERGEHGESQQFSSRHDNAGAGQVFAEAVAGQVSLQMLLIVGCALIHRVDRRRSWRAGEQCGCRGVVGGRGYNGALGHPRADGKVVAAGEIKSRGRLSRPELIEAPCLPVARGRGMAGTNESVSAAGCCSPQASGRQAGRRALGRRDATGSSAVTATTVVPAPQPNTVTPAQDDAGSGKPGQPGDGTRPGTRGLPGRGKPCASAGVDSAAMARMFIQAGGDTLAQPSAPRPFLDQPTRAAFTRSA